MCVKTRCVSWLCCSVWHVGFKLRTSSPHLALWGHRTSYCDFTSAMLWLQNLKHLPPVSCFAGKDAVLLQDIRAEDFPSAGPTERDAGFLGLRRVCVLSAWMFVRRACSFSTAIFRLPRCPPAPLVYGSETPGDTKTQFSILYPHMVSVCACWNRNYQFVGAAHVFTRSN